MKNAALILMLFFATTSFSQSISDEPTFDARVKSSKPTVFLEYVCQDKKKTYFRMYNNTTWHISVAADNLYYQWKKPIVLQNGVSTYAVPNDREVPLQYRIERSGPPWEKVKVPQVASSDNGFSNWIASQDSILFSVPTNYLRKDLQVFVRFEYEWEVPKKGYTLNDPENRVSFRGVDLLDTKPSTCESFAHFRLSKNPSPSSLKVRRQEQ